MDNWVYYEGASTKNFDILASWFYEVYGKMLRLEEANKQLREANEQYRDDYIRLKNGYDEFKLRNRDLAEENKNLKTERSKTEEVLKRYCGDSVDAPISTMVGLIIDDFFYQKAETECQVKELQKAEKTIDKLNKELVEYADKVEKLEKCACSIPTFPILAEKINDITCKYHMPVTPLDRRKARSPHIFQCVQELVEYAKKQRDHIYTQDSTIASQTERINDLEKKNEELEKMRWLPDWCQVIDKLDEIIDEEAPERRPSCLYLGRVEEIIDKISRIKNAIHGRNQVLDQRKATIDRLRKENEKLIHVQGDNAIEHATEITDLKQEISALKKELEERKNERSPRWWSDVMRIEVLKTKADKLTKENRRLREEVESLKGQNEVLKIKNAYPICPIFEANSKEAANRIAERIRKELD